MTLADGRTIVTSPAISRTSSVNSLTDRGRITDADILDGMDANKILTDDELDILPAGQPVDARDPGPHRCE